MAAGFKRGPIAWLRCVRGPNEVFHVGVTQDDRRGAFSVHREPDPGAVWYISIKAKV
ncbi:MAG: hypothetical protein ABJN98_22515 [Roseibium sp.]